MGKIIFTILFTFGFSQIVFGVSNYENESHKTHAWVTTRIAEIAHSDVQIRHLMKMFSTKKIASESYFDQMQKLQSKKSK